uniref:RAD9-HUS1-RAD1 interacting nuclear orphan 1 n=1 Tax=Nothobranchius rachovii TaxID=451742 RepID=A0A1A8QTZ3_9TELE
MPRKVSKTDKPALTFVERPLGGARRRNLPEVRAAINPRDFFNETQKHSSTLDSWVNPQFDCSAAPPVRRGRRRCQSATSILDKCSQLPRKTRVCKFPSLSFQSGTRDKFQKPKSTATKKGAETIVLSKVRNQPQGSCERERGRYSESETLKKQFGSLRKRNADPVSEGAASHKECSDQPGTQSAEVTNRCRIPAEGVSTPSSAELNATEVSNVNPPPEADTPKPKQRGGSPSCSSVLFLLAQPCTPPCNKPPAVLVEDTPEEDYGVKATWRRRKALMMMLKEKGYLSESDSRTHN